MSINSRAKGCRGERLLRDVFKDHGFDARRGMQFSGSPDSPDVVVPDLEYIHVECKFVENLNINKAMEQSKSDSRDDQMPMVFHKKKNTDWLVTMTIEDFFEIIIKNHDIKQKEKGKVCHCSNGEDAGGKLGPSNPENLG